MKEGNATPIRVSLVEDKPDVLADLASLLEGTPGMNCISTHRSGEEALSVLPQLQPDVVLMDIHLTGMTGIDCVRQLKPLLPRVLTVMVTMYDNDELIFNALTAGADGYVLKRSRPAEIIGAIREVVAGGAPMSGNIARRVIEAFRKTPQPQQPPAAAAPDTSGIDGLSTREMEILELLAKGYLYKEIASMLFISIETVRSHAKNIYRKLHVRSRTQAVVKLRNTHTG